MYQYKGPSLFKVLAFLLQIYCSINFNFKQLTLYPSVYTINTATVYTFDFGRANYNNGTETPWNSNLVPSTANISVAFPSDYALTGSQTCTSLSIVSRTASYNIATFNCTITANTVIFRDALTSVTDLFIQSVKAVISNIKNPYPAITTGQFVGYVGIDMAFPNGGASIILTAASFADCSVTFGNGGYVNQTSPAIITLTPSNPLNSSSSVVVRFPNSKVWSQDISSTILPITTGTMSCSNLTNVNTGVSCFGNFTAFTVTSSNMFSSTMQNRFSFQINNFLSPPTLRPIDQITITSFISTFRVDTCNVSISNLVANQFIILTIKPIQAMFVNGKVGVTINMTFADTLDRDDQFQIIFPNSLNVSYTNVTGSGSLGSSSLVGKTLTVAQNTAATQFYFTQSFLAINFYTLTAPPSTRISDSITVNVLRNGFLKMTGIAQIQALPQSIQGAVSATLKTVFASTTYTFNITLNDPLSSSGWIKIIFPSQIILPSSVIAVLSGIALNSSPTPTINSLQNSVTLRSLNASSSLISNQTLRVTLSSIRNAGTTSPSSNFTIQSYYDALSDSLVATGQIQGVTATQGTLDSTKILLTASSYVVLASTVTYTINFVTTYTIPQNGFVVVKFPIDITIDLTNGPDNCFQDFNSSGTPISSDCSIVRPSNYQINFTTLATSSSINAGTNISLSLRGVCTNPDTTRNINGFTISTYSNAGYIIQGASSGISIQMTTPAQCSSVSVTRSNHQNSALASYNISLAQRALLNASSILIITFPSILSFSIDSNCTDLSGINSLTCLATSLTLTVTLTSGRASLQVFGVIVTKVINPPSFKPLSASSAFVILTKTPDGISSYCTFSFSSPLTNSIASTFSNVSGSFSPQIFLTSTVLTIKFKPSTRIIPSYLLINLQPSMTVGTVGLTSTGISSPAYNPLSLYNYNISGTFISSQMEITITGLTSPKFNPTDFTKLISYETGGFKIDQSLNDVQFITFCTVPCRTCDSVKKNLCLSCYQDTTISLNIYFLSSENLCFSDCPTGYFQNSTIFICQVCSSNCQTCEFNAANCTSCNQTSQFPFLNRTLSVGTCLAECPTFFYADYTQQPTLCIRCQSPCNNCLNKSVCLSCVSPFFYYIDQCIGSCPNLQTITNPTLRTCDNCSSECATCSINTTNCVDCAIDAAKYNNTCVTICPPPLVVNNGECAACDTRCLTCSINFRNCTSCNTSSSFKFLLNNKCLAVCDQLYYPDIINGVCNLCSTLNIGCNNCSSTSTCHSCNTGFVFLSSKCYNYVPIGYVNMSGIAVLCTGDCATCSVLPGNCTACVTRNLIGNQCNATCPNSTVAVNKVCTQCTAPCFTCSNIRTNCTSCLTNWTSVVFLNNFACNSTCPDYTYKNFTNYQCTPCVPPCLKCTSKSLCTQCQSGRFLLAQQCELGCPAGYLGIGKVCQKCTPPCDTCSLTLTSCLTCLVNFYLYNSSSPSCISNCTTVGLYPGIDQQICEGCAAPCSTCTTTSSTCSSCLTGYLYQSYCYSPCPQGTFITGATCTDCPVQCRTCNSSTICLSCQLNYFLFVNFCVQVCPQTHPVITSNNSCAKCTNSACSICNQNDYCLSCMSPFYLIKGNCLGACPSGYSPDPKNTSNCIVNKTQSELNSALSSSGGDLFPVPFTIGALFIGIATIMSKFQNSQTFVSGALYSLWGVLQWASLAVVLYLFYIQYGYQKIQFYILGGSMVLGYLLNFFALLIQNCYLVGDAKMNKWKQYKVHQCWFYFVSALGFISTHKFKNILFCKLFNFHILKAHLQDVQKFRIFNVFSFLSLIQSGGVIFGTCLILFTYTQSINQTLMQYIDVLILTIANIILAILNSRKQADFFEHKDDDGFIFNRRIQQSDQILSGLIVLPSTKQEGYDYGNTPFKQSNSTSRRLDSLSQYEPYSVQNRSIQADPLLGMDSRITHLDDYSMNSLNIFQHSDKGIQKDDISIPKQDRSIDQTAKILNQMSIQMDSISHQEVSIQFQPHHQQVSIQFAPNNMDEGVGMSREEVQMGMQAYPNIQDYSVQYSAKPVFLNIDQDYMSEQQSSKNNISKDDIFVPQTVKVESRLQAQLQLDIDQKLRKRQEQLQRLQWQRKQEQKQKALADFKKKKQKLMQQKKQRKDGQEKQKQKQKDKVYDLYNNESAKDQTSFLSSNADLIVNMKNKLMSSNQSKVENRSIYSRLQTQNQKTQKQFIELLSNQKETQQNQNESNQLEHSNQISLNMTAQMQNHYQNQRVVFQSNNIAIQSSSQEQLHEGNNQPRNSQQLNQNEISKSVSTKFMTTVKGGRKPPLPRNSRQNQLQDTSQDMQRTFTASQEDQIVNNPIRPDVQHLRKNNRHHYPVQYKQQNIDYQQRTNLTQFLSKKNRPLTSATLNRKINQNLDQQVKFQSKQQPLPLPQFQKSERQNLQFDQVEKVANEPFTSEEGQITKNMPKGIKFRNKSKVKPRSQEKANQKLRKNQLDSNQFQRIPYNVDDPLAKQLQKQQKKAQNRKKSIQYMEQLLERPSHSGQRNFLKSTFASQQKKKKSLQKVYLNRGNNKQK